jgi:hypothetical protein
MYTAKHLLRSLGFKADLVLVSGKTVVRAWRYPAGQWCVSASIQQQRVVASGSTWPSVL